jgi:hypothetical protein
VERRRHTLQTGTKASALLAQLNGVRPRGTFAILIVCMASGGMLVFAALPPGETAAWCLCVFGVSYLPAIDGRHLTPVGRSVLLACLMRLCASGVFLMTVPHAASIILAASAAAALSTGWGKQSRIGGKELYLLGYPGLRKCAAQTALDLMPAMFAVAAFLSWSATGPAAAVPALVSSGLLILLAVTLADQIFFLILMAYVTSRTRSGNCTTAQVPDNQRQCPD